MTIELNLKKGIELLAQKIKEVRNVSHGANSGEPFYKEVAAKTVLRSSLPVVGGAGNSQEWRVTFDKPFTEIPIVSICVYRPNKMLYLWTTYDVTVDGFTISTNYAGPDVQIGYFAFVPK
jgi:H-type lectin domain|nr:MAG TPA: H-type lectin domain [Caudoviricetes sp.]